jgi:hypothetical protein
VRRITRDLLIGAVPPAALRVGGIWPCRLRGAAMLLWSSLIKTLRNPVRMLGAMGLALSAIGAVIV